MKVVVGIPAHNEEGTIEQLLCSIVAQERQGFTLERIHVACDGCTDRTVSIAQRVAKAHPEIYVDHDGQHAGKNVRLNRILQQYSPDVFLFLDADVILNDVDSFATLLHAFYEPQVGLVAGNIQPARARTFVERVEVAMKKMWYYTKKDLNGGDTPHNVTGAYFAISDGLAKQLQFPPKAHGDDHFVYHTCKHFGYAMKYVDKATVLYHNPATIHDFVAQSVRFMHARMPSLQVYGSDKKACYVIPMSYKIKGIANSLRTDPFFTIMAILFESYVRLHIALFGYGMQGARWKRIASSK